MTSKRYPIRLLLMPAIWISLSSLTGAEEYCLPEVFHAECAATELIVVERALFGRMELGRCVTRNYGHVGCAVDVLPVVDQACSGRRTCDLTVSDPALVRTKPCPKDFASYLDADYSCVPYINIDTKTCQDTGLLVITQTEGYISGSEMLFSKCVLAFKMAADQRLNVTLLDFTAVTPVMVSGAGGGGSSSSLLTSQFNGSSLAVDDGSSHCHVQYATITELPPLAGTAASSSTGSGSSVIVCSRSERRRHILTSRSSHVQMRVIPSRDARYLIKFEVLGCGEIVLPPNTHVHRDRAGLTVICNVSRETFRLVCIGRKWTGTLHNCSKTVLPRRSDVENSEEFSVLPPLGVSVVIAVGIALVIVVYATLLVVCVLFIRKRYRRQRIVQREPEDADFNASSTTHQQTRLFVSPTTHSAAVVGLCDMTSSMTDRHLLPSSVPANSMYATHQAGNSCHCSAVGGGGNHQHRAVSSAKPDVTETERRYQQSVDYDCWPMYGIVAGTGHRTLPGRFHSKFIDNVSETIDSGPGEHRVTDQTLSRNGTTSYRAVQQAVTRTSRQQPQQMDAWMRDSGPGILSGSGNGESNMAGTIGLA